MNNISNFWGHKRGVCWKKDEVKGEKNEEEEKYEMNEGKELQNEEADACNESKVECEDLLHRLFDGWIECFYFVSM